MARAACARPTGDGCVISGFANRRAVVRWWRLASSPLEATSIETLNGARHLGREPIIGSIAPDERADRVVANGDPSRTIGAQHPKDRHDLPRWSWLPTYEVDRLSNGRGGSLVASCCGDDYVDSHQACRQLDF
jgi:hypothetical protein